jgi:hypothetical protein
MPCLLAARVRRLLTADNSRSQAIALDEALDFALQLAIIAWDGAEGMQSIRPASMSAMTRRSAGRSMLPPVKPPSA